MTTYKNLTAQELYATLTNDTLYRLFSHGMQTENQVLAISTMEALIKQKETNLVVKVLDSHLNIKGKSALKSLIALSLYRNCTAIDPILSLYGKYLNLNLDSNYQLAPTDWLKREVKTSLFHPNDIENAQAWAKRYLA